MEIDKNLRRLLTQRRMTVAQLSLKADVPAKTIYHWTSGQQPRNIQQLLRVCRVLDTSIEALFGGGEIPKAVTTYISLGELKSDMHLGVFEVVLRPIKSVSKKAE